MPEPPRVLIVDDHPLVRSGLRELFDGSPDFAVCAAVGSAAEALQAAEELQPALCTVDLGLEGRSGLDLIAQLRQACPGVPVLVVSMWDERIYAGRAFKAGAQGYVTKARAPETVLDAASQVLAGQTYASEAAWASIEEAAPVPAGAEPARNGRRGDSPNEGKPAIEVDSEALDVLTNREMEVFVLIGQGHAPRSIAERLSVSVSTVESHRQRLKEKLGLGSSGHLRRFATQWVRRHL